jgi:NADPH:quinone reductase-like Zn-dependent oxidoreductase
MRRSYLRAVGQFLGMPWFNPFKLMSDNRGVVGLNLGHLWGEQQMLRRHIQELVALFEAGKIKPHVDKVFPLSQGAEAHRYVQERKNVGKVLFDCTA